MIIHEGHGILNMKNPYAAERKKRPSALLF